MMQRIALSLWMGALTLIPAALFASTATDNICSGASISSNCNGNDLTAQVGNITSTLLTVAGAVAVIIIIIGGIAYITSSGDSSRIKLAKDTVLYAVIGLVVVIIAYAIVNFVIKNI